MTAATFILMYKTPADVAASNDAINFFKWSYDKGDQMATDLDYIPMPDNVVKLVESDVGQGHQAEVTRAPGRRAASPRVPAALSPYSRRS